MSIIPPSPTQELVKAREKDKQKLRKKTQSTKTVRKEGRRSYWNPYAFVSCLVGGFFSGFMLYLILMFLSFPPLSFVVVGVVPVFISAVIYVLYVRKK